MTHNLNNLKHSFGAIAAQYDAARPGYPAAVVAAILAPFADDARLSILEIGCGSGQATQLFAERGHRIVASDLSADLVAVAQQRLAAFPNARFAVGAFEELLLPEHLFDLIISAQAFHWVDPVIGLPKVARLLKPRGRLALFWNFVHYDATPLLQSIRDVCVQHAPAFVGWPDASEQQFSAFAEYWSGSLESSAHFADATQTVHATTLSYAHAQFQQLITTFSWFQTQPSEVRAALLGDIAALLCATSEPLVLPVRTLLIEAAERR